MCIAHRALSSQKWSLTKQTLGNKWIQYPVMWWIAMFLFNIIYIDSSSIISNNQQKMLQYQTFFNTGCWNSASTRRPCYSELDENIAFQDKKNFLSVWHFNLCSQASQLDSLPQSTSKIVALLAPETWMSSWSNNSSSCQKPIRQRDNVVLDCKLTHLPQQRYSCHLSKVKWRLWCNNSHIGKQQEQHEQKGDGVGGIVEQ